LRAAQFGRPITAVRASGGYRISGQGPFVSNCYDANWIAMTAIVTLEDQTQDDDKGEPEVLMVYFPSATLTPEETFDFPKNQVRILHREKVATAAHRLYLRAGDNF
jgi:alkylation response protein AidB-like acyl-CoA dehydrogenase